MRPSTWFTNYTKKKEANNNVILFKNVFKLYFKGNSIVLIYEAKPLFNCAIGQNLLRNTLIHK